MGGLWCQRDVSWCHWEQGIQVWQSSWSCEPAAATWPCSKAVCFWCGIIDPPPSPSPCLVSDEARSKKCGILVHCLAGISRSVTVTVAYLMQKLNLSLNDAYDFVKRKKSNISPNFNFMGQLLDFERTLGLNSPCDNRSPSEQLYFTTPTNHNLFQLNTLEST